ncbi:MAG: chromosome segregation protein SMC [Lachnospiraceae bacterium]|nr:chromosome segregation protein SMC [Lachnospiraceae bacterium]
MYLKGIEMQGFKSFANKIRLDFKDGITGIVGPNGSGKSNVADAVRWVLGEQSARELRGASMTDVIFSGTETRKPMGYAYVSLYMDNSDRMLDMDYEEIVVSRRVYRSGESEYLINGSTCRLKDIEELFFDTGIGKEGYSIIGQGQVEKILSGKPEERRELFDEAAGIVKFRKRKNASLKKLEREHDNLVRVNDIISELEHQVEPLKVQAEKARLFLDKRETLKGLDVNAFLLESDRVRAELKKLDEKILVAGNDAKEVNTQYEANRKHYEEAVKKIAEFEELIEKKREELQESRMQRGKLQGEIGVMKEQVNSLKLSLEHFKKRIAELSLDRERYTQEAERLREEKKQLDEKVKAAEDQGGEDSGALEESRARLAEMDGTLEKDKAELLTLLNERGQIKAEIERYDIMLEQTRSRSSELDVEISSRKEGIQEIKDQAGAELKTLEELEGKLKGFEEKKSGIEEELEEFGRELEKKNQAHHDLEVRYHEKKARLESLVNMAERYEGYGGAVKAVMEQKRSNKGICGVVADLIKVEEKYENAIETALGGNIQNIVTRDEATAKKMISYLKEQHAGRATFLPLTSITERSVKEKEALSAKGVIGQADTLVKFSPEFSRVASTLLGNYIVVDNVDNALALAKDYRYTLRIVTLSGEALNPGGSIAGGAFRDRSNLLGRYRDIDRLKEECRDTLKEIDGILAGMEELQDKRREGEKTLKELSEEVHETEIKRNTVTLNLKNLKDREEEIKSGESRIHAERIELDENLVQIGENRERSENALKASIKRENELGEAIESLTAKRIDEEALHASLIEKQTEKEKAHASLLQEQRFLSSNLERLKMQSERSSEDIEALEEEIKQNNERIEEKNRAIEELGRKIEEDNPDSEENNTALKELIDRKEKLQEDQQSIFTERDELSDRKNALENELVRLNSQKERLDSGFDGLRDYMWSEYELSLTAAEELRSESDLSLPEMRRRISSLKNEIRGLGDVNVGAIEQYRDVSERYNFLTGQRSDILSAEEDLKKAIGELDEAMREQFSREFKRIGEQYDLVFKELFGGGHGRVELTDSEDVLEAGIRITAEPPGKKLQNMMQLSGGEKALSAIALLFGIQRLKPSPFCLLDEIEAALDEANVERFAGYLSRLSGHTQFIVITHRRGTMMKADRLYGITMQEKGVSTEVNVDLSDEAYD